MKGKLILENGLVFEGEIFGKEHDCVGELVFNTGMTGYQESLTDPSYYGQMVVMTYPLVGNYGTNLCDMESDRIHMKALIVKEVAECPSNFRSEKTLDKFLKDNNVVGFKSIDTRHLTKIIRENGTTKAIITTRDLSKNEINELLSNWNNDNAVKEVSTKHIYEINGLGPKIGIIDFGIKNNIIRSFRKRKCKMVVFPWNTKADEILKYNLDGLFLSNGPGDPSKLTNVIEEIKKIIGKLPIIGICLGHQLLALSLGGTTTKLKYGHRGCNHPVKDLKRNKIFITSQNHGYVVDKVPNKMEVTHINLNDKSIEGLKSDDLNILCVQYHPEAWPGPNDSEYLFDDFLEVIEKSKKGGHNVR